MDDASAQGKVAVITGANVGIGLATAVGIASAGATTVLACRNQEKAEAAAKTVREESGARRVSEWSVLLKGSVPTAEPEPARR
jgi:NAD(P)-dependent dehydrogenase (short-subunit alcohol dehydrogenase family)